MQRRHFFTGAATALAAASVGRAALAAIPEAVQQTSADTAPPWTPPGVTGAGRPYSPVLTLNGWTLPWRMNNGVKEFHLVAEPVVREMAPGFLVNMWGYNGQSPGPDHRGGRGRQGAPVRDQPPARAHRGALARPAPARRHGRRGRPEPAADPAGQDLRLRVRGAPPRHLHVPPARRRDGADGHGHDGLLGHAPERQTPAHQRGAARRLLPAQRL